MNNDLVDKIRDFIKTILKNPWYCTFSDNSFNFFVKFKIPSLFFKFHSFSRTT